MFTLGPDRRTIARFAYANRFHEADKGGGGGGAGGEGKSGDDSGDKKSGEGKTGDGDKKGEKDFKPIESQEDFDAAITGRLRRLEKSVRADIRKELEEELKTEAATKAAEENGNYKELYEKSQKEVERLKGELKTTTVEDLREKSIKKYSLPDDVADLLVGETEEELEASAKKLAKYVKPKVEDENIDTGNSNRAPKRKGKGGDGKKDYEEPNFWLSEQ